MKIVFPSLKVVIKITIVALVLALIAYLVTPLVDFPEMQAKLFAAGAIFLGAVIGGFIASLGGEIKLFGSQPVSIFIGNLAFKANAKDLHELFSGYGKVINVRVMTDRATRRPKGFAFVEMDKKGAKAAIAELDGSEFFGRDIKVNYATRRKNAA